MSEYREQFAYWLTVEGSKEDLQKVHELLRLNDELKDRYYLHNYLSPEDKDEVPPKTYITSGGSVEEWNEAEQEEVLHKIALAVPNAVLTLQGECVESRHSSFVFKKQFHGNLYQDVFQQTYLPELSEDRFVAFENRFGPLEHKRPSLDEVIKEYSAKQKEERRQFIAQLFARKYHEDPNVPEKNFPKEPQR